MHVPSSSEYFINSIAYSLCATRVSCSHYAQYTIMYSSKMNTVRAAGADIYSTLLSTSQFSQNVAIIGVLHYLTSLSLSRRSPTSDSQLSALVAPVRCYSETCCSSLNANIRVHRTQSSRFVQRAHLIPMFMATEGMLACGWVT